MGTRSTIALEFADGTVQQVYCHWDGYLSHNGQILQEHYSDPFKLRDLIDLGDLSSLGPNIGEAHPFSQFGLNKEDPDFDEMMALYEKSEALGWCTFYARDRGEEGTGAKRFKNFEDYVANHQYEEYEYILRQVDGRAVWFVKCHSEDWKTLEQAMVEETTGEIA
jgi:hypothetical protein